VATDFRFLVASLLFANLIAAPWRPASAASPAAPACPPILNQSQPRLQDGAQQNLCQYAGRVLLVVNTASACGYTSQYEGMEQLNARFAGRGLVVMGFPSDSFRQEPKDDRANAQFCFDTFGVKFPMFAKSAVVGPKANPLFAQLKQATGQAPQWNFHKFLIDRQGRVVADFASAVEPTDARLVARLEQLLEAK
jgi:glutathione peroxidase